MRRLVAATSIVLLGLAAPAFSQANMGMDASGRIDGRPPLGTSPGTEEQNGLQIPLDSFETGSVTSDSSTMGTVDWAKCPPRKARATTATESAACR